MNDTLLNIARDLCMSSMREWPYCGRHGRAKDIEHIFLLKADDRARVFFGCDGGARGDCEDFFDVRITAGERERIFIARRDDSDAILHLKSWTSAGVTQIRDHRKDPIEPLYILYDAVTGDRWVYPDPARTCVLYVDMNCQHRITPSEGDDPETVRKFVRAHRESCRPKVTVESLTGLPFASETIKPDGHLRDQLLSLTCSCGTSFRPVSDELYENFCSAVRDHLLRNPTHSEVRSESIDIKAAKK